MAQMSSNSPDLAVPPLHQHHLQQTALGPALQQLNLSRPSTPAIEHKTLTPSIEGASCWLTLDQNPVGLGVVVTGMGELKRQRPVICQQQSPAAVGIESAHRMEPPTKILRQQIQHGGPAMRVMAGADHPNGFVDQEHPRILSKFQTAAIHNDQLLIGVGLIAETGDLAVNGHAPGLQPGFGLASRTETSCGHELLQALPSHALTG